MRIVHYYDADGKRHESDFIGTPDEIRSRLDAQGATVIRITAPSVWRVKKVNDKELSQVLAALADLLASGMSFSKALETIIASFDKSSPLKGIFSTIHHSIVNDGKTFSQAFSGYQHVFDKTIIAMMQAGEESGSFAQSITAASQYIETLNASKAEVRKSLTEPVITLLIGCVVLMFNTWFTMPRIMNSPLMRAVNNGGDTNIFIRILDAVAFSLPFIFAFAGILYIAMRYAKLSKSDAVERYLLKIPMLRELTFYRGFYVAFYSLTNLLTTGLHLSDALRIVRDATDMGIVQKDMQRAYDAVKKGKHFSSGLHNISPIERAMLEIAKDEEAIKKNLERVYKRFFDQYIRKVRSLAPKTQVIVYASIITLILLMVLGLFIPYGKVLGGIHA
ncbi:MAG: type II secretion system F family protein [Nitrospirae bacterium]|nr:type II secretion system F family protein [Nitrospirota bacterium]